MTKLRSAWHKTAKLHNYYLQQTKTREGWLQSWFPTHEAFILRKQLNASLRIMNNLIKQTENITMICHQRLRRK